MPDTPTSVPQEPVRTVFRLPRTAYIGVLLLAFCTVPFAFGGAIGGNDNPSDGRLSVLTALLILPLAVAAYIARTRTVVAAEGITVRLLFGQRLLPWSQLRGLLLQGSAVYAVLTDEGAVRLPCVTHKGVSVLTRVSGGHLPELDLPPIKVPPGRRRR